MKYITLYAKWTANIYTVKYNGNGATSGSTASSTHTYNSAKTLTANGFTRAGYTFTGWNTKADGTGTAYANQASVKNLTTAAGSTVTLYAQWSVVNYSISYNLKGGSASNKTSYNVNTSSFTLAKPSLSGWTFRDWTGTGLSSYTTSVTISKGSTGNRSYIANYYRTVDGSKGAGGFSSPQGSHIWKNPIKMSWTGASNSYWVIKGRYSYPEEDTWPSVSGQIFCDGAWRSLNDSNYIASKSLPSIPPNGYNNFSVTTKMGKNCSKLKLTSSSNGCFEHFYISSATRYYNSTEYK